jgi:hypothetical protein
MQKVQSYLYPNRVILIAELAGFNVENTIVYAKTVKIYKGVDNIIQFDIQNADQKRLDLVTSSPITGIRMNLMDISGKALPESPYVVYPHDTIKGIGVVTIPSIDLDNIQNQSLQYSVTATDTNGKHIPLYTDSRFSAVGIINVVQSAAPVTRKEIVWDRFSGEINYMGNIINHSSSYQCKFYEAVPTTLVTFNVDMTNFVGSLYIEGTKDSTISVESFRNADKLQTFTTSIKHTEIGKTFTIEVNDYNYLRVSWIFPDIWQYGSQDPSTKYGSVDKITITS